MQLPCYLRIYRYSAAAALAAAHNDAIDAFHGIIISMTAISQICCALCLDITGKIPLPPPPLPSHASSQGAGGGQTLEDKWSGRCKQKDIRSIEKCNMRKKDPGCGAAALAEQVAVPFSQPQLEHVSHTSQPEPRDRNCGDCACAARSARLGQGQPVRCLLETFITLTFFLFHSLLWMSRDTMPCTSPAHTATRALFRLSKRFLRKLKQMVVDTAPEQRVVAMQVHDFMFASRQR